MSAFSLLSAFLSATASAQPSLLGYTGLINVPTAAIRTDLALAFRWESGPNPVMHVPGTAPVDRSYLVALPLLPGTEVSLSGLQEIGWHDPQVPVLPDAVHRALGVKAGGPLPFVPGLRLAVGMVDPVSVNFLYRGPVGKTHYGLTSGFAVATETLGPLSLTLGYGLGDRTTDKTARSTPFLDGTLGGLDWALPLGFEALGEWDGENVNGALRWNGPWGLGLMGGRAGGGWTAGASWAIRL